MILWGGKYRAEECIIYYRHRGVPGDFLSIPVSEITDLGQMFFHTEGTAIPYHRILLISCGREIIWKKKGEDTSFIDR